jgi:hypothetical protein
MNSQLTELPGRHTFPEMAWKRFILLSCKKFLDHQVSLNINHCNLRRTVMIKKILSKDRLRSIKGTFAFIEHRFLQEGYFSTLTHHELILYIFLILVSDRHGISWYAYDNICATLRLTLEEYIIARNSLIDKDLISTDGYFFQVLSLPPKESMAKFTKILKNHDDMARTDPATIHYHVREQFGGGK